MRSRPITIVTCVTSVACAAATVRAGGPVVLNEIRTDQPSNAEYAELAGPAGASLTGLTLIVIGDGSGGDGTIEEVTSLDGEALGPDGLFLIAEDDNTFGAPADLLTNLNFENNDNITVVLVSGFSGNVGTDVDTNNDGVIDVTPWTGVVDAVGLIESPNPPTGTEYAYGATLGFEDVGPDADNGDKVPTHVYRCALQGLWVIGHFDGNAVQAEDTPGATNEPCPAGCDPALSLGSTPPPGGWDPGDPVIVQVWMTGLCGLEAAGFQAFLQFDCDQLELVGGVYTLEPFGLHIIAPIDDDGAGRVDLASGINQFAGQQPTTDDAVLAVLAFTALVPVGVPDVVFRPHEPPTRITDPSGVAIQPLVLLDAPCPEDVNHDGEVDVDDLVAVILAWGMPSCGADVNADGNVDVDDLLAVILAWGPCEG